MEASESRAGGAFLCLPKEEAFGVRDVVVPVRLSCCVRRSSHDVSVCKIMAQVQRYM